MGIHICYDGTYIRTVQAICVVLSNDRINWSKMPSDAEFTNIEITIAVLGSLSIFTDALSGEKWVNISVVRPLLNHILDTPFNPSDDDIALKNEACYIK